jgi:serine/threonine-protein kinase
MATVFVALDRRHGRRVAIKVLLPELAGAVSHARFLAEIRLTAKLHHPHILPLHDSGIVDGLPFYVMPYIDGESLRARLLRERRLPVNAVLRLGQQVADALAYAHDQQVVHRDIKPENILIHGDHAYVADFGIARAVERSESSGVTASGVVVGTPGYMSPEQAGGRTVDRRSDIYSLGCVLYEALTGALPSSPVSVSDAVHAGVPAVVARAIARACAADPVARLPDARAFAASLTRSPIYGSRVQIAPMARRLAIATLVIIAVGGAVALIRRSDLGSRTTLREPVDLRRVAVLYFDDQSPGHTLGYLASGLTEGLIRELSATRAIHVISRNGVKPFRDRVVLLDSIRAALQVGSIVEGSVQQSGDRLRVAVQLVDAGSGMQVASSTLERPMGELFEMEDDVAHVVAAGLRHRLGTEVRLGAVVAGTTSLGAREGLLRGLEAREDAETIIADPDTVDTFTAAALLARADSLLVSASIADPDWVRPLVERGWVSLDRARVLTGAASARVFQRGLALADEAVRRAPGNATALELRGTAAWRLARQEVAIQAHRDPALESRAEHDLRAAVALDPSLASAWGTLSQLLRLDQGNFAEADSAARRALAEDAYLSDAPTILDQLYRSALMIPDYKAAIKWCDIGSRDYPRRWQFVECKLTLLREDQSLRPDPRLAWSLVRALDTLDPPVKTRATGHPYSSIYREIVAATISAKAGDRDSARAVLARARRAVAGDRELATDLDYDEAYLRFVLDEPDSARRLLDLYVAANPIYRSFIARDPLVRALASRPRTAGTPRN